MRYYIELLLAVILYSSCDRPECTNHRAIFNEYSPEDIEYKKELVRLIDSIGKDNIGYWIKKYKRIGERDIMEVYLQHDVVCAVGIFDITGAERFGHYISVKGMSYSGAELSGLDLEINNSDDSVGFLLHDVDWIID